MPSETPKTGSELHPGAGLREAPPTRLSSRACSSSPALPRRQPLGQGGPVPASTRSELRMGRISGTQKTMSCLQARPEGPRDLP